MSNEIRKGIIFMITFVIVIFLSGIGAIFLIDIVFDTTFENYDNSKFTILILSLTLIVLIWSIIFAWYETRGFLI